MKKLYTTTLILLFSFILQVYFPFSVSAQCLCAAGAPAATLSQTITLPPTTTSSLNFTFQQFNPALGTLSCAAIFDTLTGISTTGARNTGPDTTAFLFLLSLTNKITGPGITITRPFTETYGYDTLSPYHIPGDTITYGPTNIITNPVGQGYTSGNAAYLGIGTVNFNYSVNGGMITMDGGSNYRSSVTTIIGGTITLIYYYCPMALLASNMLNFSAVKKDNTIILSWHTQNAEAINEFDIEYSSNGKDFISVAKVANDHGAPAGNYNYNYDVNNNSDKYAYFRIKQISNNNNSGYSPVQKILLGEKTSAGITIHPNPATTGLGISFDRVLNGEYSVDLVNLAGQVVINKKVKLVNSNTIPVNWASKPAPGIYFTRITNTNSMEQQIIRVIIQ